MLVRPDAQLKLIAAARSALGGEVDGVDDVRRQQLDYDAFLAGRSVARIHGCARAGRARLDFSLIEKVTDAPATVSAYLYDNAEREFHAYRSGLLRDLAPGLTAPQMLWSELDSDGALTLWIEDLGPRAAPLSSSDLVVSARHLGRLSGRWLGRVPPNDWLFGGWLERHQQSPALAGGLAAVEAAAGNPDVESRLEVAEAVDLIRRQDEYRVILEALPVTLCHHDAVAANVFLRDHGGAPETVLIDWESVGPGPVGADLVSLLFSSARRGDISARWLPALIPAALEAYAHGVREMGAEIDDRELRSAFTAAIALRWTLVRDVIRALNGEGVVRRGSAMHEPPDTALDELVLLTRVLLDAARQARTLS